MTTANSVYLNHAGTSWPKPPPVTLAADQALHSDPGTWPETFESAHREIANFFHIPAPEQLLFTPACTSALSLAIADMFWKPGDRVLISHFEHHALHRPVTKLVDWGVDVELIPHLPHEPILLEALEEMLKAGRVTLVAMTAACNVTGDVLPFEEVIPLAHQYGAKVLLDAAQVAGWWDFDIPKSGADMVAFAGHKGLQAPWGIGGLYVAPELELNVTSAACQLNFDEATGNVLPPPSKPSWCDAGSVDRIALAGLAASVRWLREPTQADRLAHARRLATSVRERLISIEQVTVFGHEAAEERMPTIAFTLADQSPTEVSQILQTQGIHVAAGLQCAPLAHKALETQPEGVLRISFGPQSTSADADQVIEAIRDLL